MSFRIDEFAKTPDGSISAADRVRYTGVGFDILSSAAPPASSGAGWMASQSMPIPGRWRAMASGSFPNTRPS